MGRSGPRRNGNVRRPWPGRGRHLSLADIPFTLDFAAGIRTEISMIPSARPAVVRSPYPLLFPVLVAVAAAPAPAAAQGATVGLDPRIEAVLQEIDPERLLYNIEMMASFGTRNTMSVADHPEWGIGAAREWIRREMQGYSNRLVVEFDRYDVEPAGRIAVPTDLRNVIAVLPGRSERRIYVSGHYDSVAREVEGVPEAPTEGDWDHYAPGANDDASGVSVAMELARVLSRSGIEFDATLVFIGFAGEEQGLVGARHHVERALEEGIPIDAVFNNDIVGNARGGNGILDSRTTRIFSEGPEDSLSRNLARYIRRVAAWYVPGHDVRLIARRDRFGRGGDHTPFDQAGFAAVRMTESREDYDRQHTVRDTPDGIDPEYLARNARVNAAGMASLALAPPAPRVTGAMLGRGDGYDASLRWEASEGASGYRVFWRTTWGPDWEHELYVGDVTEFTLPDISIDDYTFGVAAVGPDGHESLVSVYVR
jgi:hypothetical protein